MGTSVSLVGGGLTIAGGILTIATAGVAAPVLIAGIATSSVGAATNIGTSIVEKLLNSKQIKDLNNAFERDKMLTTKFERQIEDVKRHKDSPHLSLLYYSIKQFLGERHLLMTILKEVLLLGKEEEEERREQPSLLKQESRDGMKYNPLDAGALVEGGKVIGQNSFRMAGQVRKLGKTFEGFQRAKATSDPGDHRSVRRLPGLGRHRPRVHHQRPGEEAGEQGGEGAEGEGGHPRGCSR